MGGEDHAPAQGRVLPQHGGEALQAVLVQAHRGLVQAQDSGASAQDRSQAHPPLLPEAEGEGGPLRKSPQAEAKQSLVARLEDGARLEWLPLEAIAYRGCQAVNAMRFELAEGAEMIGWDVLALGLPAAGESFTDPTFAHGRYTQEIELPGVWLERGTVRASDHTLLDSPLGWAGKRVMATVWFAAGQALERQRRQILLDAARRVADVHPLAGCAGCTSPHEQVVLMRVLAERVEPAMALLTQVWAEWRREAWQLEPCAPRVWRT